jgi:hypothetical protein
MKVRGFEVDMENLKSPKVFISYSQDSEILADKVLELSNYFREQGIDCDIDQYYESPSEGWPRWMDNQIENSDYVLILGSKGYLDKEKFQVDSGTGRGVKWEINSIFQKLYNSDSLNDKFIPIVFEDADFSYIPTPLQGSTYYNVENLIRKEKLVNRLFGYMGVKKPNLGKPKSLEKKERKTLFLSNWIDLELWDKAQWCGVGVCYFPQSNKLYLLLNFANKEFGDKIFENWMEKLGNEDINDRIRISLIEGVFPDGIKGYYTLIGSDIDELSKRIQEQGHNMGETVFGNIQRMHRIEPKDNFKNYDMFKRKFQEIGQYYLCPIYLNERDEIKPNFELSILKHKVEHRMLKDITKNDIDAAVLNFPISHSETKSTL